MHTTRRSFLASSITTCAVLTSTSRVLGANDRIGVAVIGVKGMGRADWHPVKNQ